ncbi:MAG: radical SAM protein [Deltaproteobacteria bacterium]|nr:radical SAM protein [Deltaproteobacteria bacterium]MBI3293207.1 radical SAM protein [Deltaproteobacteria bacterium]
MRSLITKDSPIYVQYYVTARCNLACEQCNVIYSNADVREATTDEARRVAENLAELGVSVVLLTGGEPFCRKDLPEIVKAFSSNGIHVRLQTNGLATRANLEACVKAGANDISISLDSLEPDAQDTINGGVANSWTRAIRTIALVNEIFPQDSFAAFGCVLAPRNVTHIPNVIRFATEIGWWVSLVPAHTAPHDNPMSFRTFDPNLRFPREMWPVVDATLEEVKRLRGEGHNVYDSDPYFEDIKRLVRGEPVEWRRRNEGVCDSPNLYFAILPNTQMAVCCDWRLNSFVSAAQKDFPEVYRSRALRQEVKGIAQKCPGCLFGSFPEISISSRYMVPLLSRALFFGMNHEDRMLKKHSEAQIFEVAERLRSNAQAMTV